MIHLGIDENGLGPRLGPLVVTAVSARVTKEGESVLDKPARGALASRLGDSKDLVSYGDSALGEAWARAIGLRNGSVAASPADLLASLSLDSLPVLQAHCPGGHRDQCWNEKAEPSFASDTLQAAVRTATMDLDNLAKRGVVVLSARVVVVCTRAINDAFHRGESRLHVDLHSMERLVLSAREAANEEVIAVCGKVGGMERYAPHFGPLSGYLHTAIVEERAKSEYRVPGVGRIAFVRDADSGNLLVSLASLIGKWVRDLLMRRIVVHHQDDAPGAPDASGYYDPVTARFVDATLLTRRKSGLPDACFERVRTKPT